MSTYEQEFDSELCGQFLDLPEIHRPAVQKIGCGDTMI